SHRALSEHKTLSISWSHYRKPVALVGDKVSCPIPGHGTNAIIEGAPEWSSDGKAIVVDGCKCQCGCQVISGAPECAIG
ncbi:PAAR domain-containing protein, partial [Klebsiella pneumoniae]